MRFSWNPKLLLLINFAGVALAVISVAMLYQVDMLVHGLLYDYGLVFNYEWALPYWTFERVALALLGTIGGLNCFSILYLAFSRQNWPSNDVRASIPKPSVTSTSRPRRFVEREKPQGRPEIEPHPREIKEDGVDVMALPLVCNKCGKVFTQPLCMFDFKSGKPRLVNVCPYCSSVIAVSGNSKRID